MLARVLQEPFVFPSVGPRIFIFGVTSTPADTVDLIEVLRLVHTLLRIAILLIAVMLVSSPFPQAGRSTHWFGRFPYLGLPGCFSGANGSDPFTDAGGPLTTGSLTGTGAASSSGSGAASFSGSWGAAVAAIA